MVAEQRKILVFHLICLAVWAVDLYPLENVPFIPTYSAHGSKEGFLFIKL